jgi:hypothetical protein
MAYRTRTPREDNEDADQDGYRGLVGLRPGLVEAGYRGEIPKYGTAQPTIFWNAGAATDPP